MTKRQRRFEVLLEHIAAQDGAGEQSALRDFLTDLRHVAQTKGLDFGMAVEGSEWVFDEERDLEVEGEES